MATLSPGDLAAIRSGRLSEQQQRSMERVAVRIRSGRWVLIGVTVGAAIFFLLPGEFHQPIAAVGSLVLAVVEAGADRLAFAPQLQAIRRGILETVEGPVSWSGRADRPVLTVAGRRFQPRSWGTFQVSEGQLCRAFILPGRWQRLIHIEPLSAADAR